jgi:hypothetical protein
MSSCRDARLWLEMLRKGDTPPRKPEATAATIGRSHYLLGIDITD